MKRLVRPGSVAAALCVLGFAFALAVAPHRAAAGDAPPGSLIGEPAPAFTVTGLDGKPISLADFRGKTLVLNAWATWCPPCRLETPDLIRAQRKLGSSQVVFLGIDSTETAPIVRTFVAAKGVGWLQAIDDEKHFARAYDVEAIPTTFVIDPQGIVRARHEDMVSPSVLATYVAAAQQGRNSDTASALQQQIVARLAPGQFALGAARPPLRAQLAAVDAAIARADRATDDASGTASYVDERAVHAAQVVLLERAIAAAQPAAATQPALRARILRMQGDAARLQERYPVSIAAYEAALRLAPHDADALQGLAFSAYEAHAPAKEIWADQRLAALTPHDPGVLVDLGMVYARAGEPDHAAAAFTRAVALAQAAVAAAPAGAAHTSAVRQLAWVHMYFGRAYVLAKRLAPARAQFTLAAQTALELPKSNSRYAMYLEQAQEAIVALGLGAAHGPHTTVALAPWTGPDLPGSVEGTLKYRLVVAGRGGEGVQLRATDVPGGWVASFCSDRVCAPFKVGIAIPPSGVKVVEFQLIPEGKLVVAQVSHVRVTANDGSVTTSAPIP